MDTDTIFAPATGAGRAAVAVLRLSGPASRELLAALCGRIPPPRLAGLRTLRAPDGEMLDQALVLWFPGPGSYTGEDAGELQLHGGRAVLDGVAEALVGLGARPAEPGEFTRRAFLNGKLDLLAAEAIGDLIEAETAAQRRQALQQMEGALGELYRGWSGLLLRLLAQQEALIDFPDEDLPPAVEAEALADLSVLEAEMRQHLADGHRGERLREGLVFAITGPPNVGKSSLINALAGRDVAIVSPLPGTTRDVLEARVVLGGVPVTLLDTAGLRETADPVEQEGVRRARARVAMADLVIAVSDAASSAAVEPGDPGAVSVMNKVDLCPLPHEFGISARTGAGVATLRARLAAEAERLTQAAGPAPLTRARHRAAVTEAVAHLAAAQGAPLPELRGEELRLGMQALGRLTGTVGVEDVLDLIFRQFCIGK